MGLAGGLYGSFYAFVSPQDVLPILTFQIWAMLIVGGSGNNKGAILGAVLVWGIWAASAAAVSGIFSRLAAIRSRHFGPRAMASS